MKYLGTIKNENGVLRMPDQFNSGQSPETYEAIVVGDDILLVANPLDRRRLERIDRLALKSIQEHHDTLDGLAK